MIDLDRNFKEMKERIYCHMLRTRWEKYKWSVYGLRSFKYLTLNAKRGNFFEAYYILMRYIDDVVDGDIQLPDGFSSITEFVEDKINFSRKLSSPTDETDFLMLYCFELANKFGENFSQETNDLLLSLLFDAKRVGKNLLFSNEKLEHYFYLRDVRGTIRGMLKIFCENPNKFKFIEPLGVASRILDNLMDFDGDIKAGLINVPLEDFRRYGLSKDILKDKNDPKIKEWFLKEAERGILLLEEHQRNLPEADLKLFTRITLQNVYARPAEKFFKGIKAN